MIGALGQVGIYVLLVGIASFLEVPAGRIFTAFQLNALIRAGSLAAAWAALFAVDGLALPPLGWVLAAIGVGLMTGAGSICYCFSLNDLPVSLVVTLANLYLIVTIVLGVVVLHDPVTALAVAGLVCTLVGMLVLVHPPTKYGVHATAPDSPAKPRSIRTFRPMALYIVLIGAGAFLEKPLLANMDPTQLNGLLAIGMSLVAGLALAIAGPRLPRTNQTLGGLGLGAMIGIASVFYFVGLRGLPVSVAAAFSNASMIVTVLLSTLVLHQPLTRLRVGGMAVMLLGVTFLSVEPG